ncbi:MAG: chemotaxis protein CheB [Bacteroidia bacterium]|nr:chemotaxis protein CheB [Bacteroidia bacterium]MCX7763924.1 chemotaxis protein CheB [Bacteroidia bacterium]MDW8057205.1 chemotaxis protein CheB [Bacteroidia bacterium]
MNLTREEPFLWLIGGSAGSFNPIRSFLHRMPYIREVSIVLCLHRMKNPRVGILEAMGTLSGWQLSEPDDKTYIQGGHVYIAPANYHLLIEAAGYFSLSVEDPVHFSRPSIDVLFESAVHARWKRMAGALFSGANRDGAQGLFLMHKAGYFTAVQDPADAEIRTMPEAALSLFEPNVRFRAEEFVEVCLRALSL